MGYLFQGPVRSWESRGFDVAWVHSSDVGQTGRLNRLIWCDNLWLLAEDRQQLEIMIAEARAIVHEGGFRWKLSSLQVMAAGAAENSSLQDIIYTDIDGSQHCFEVVTSIVVLGEKIDHTGCSLSSICYRQTKAERNFWAHSKTFSLWQRQ